jgi:hypothetical protein
MPDQIVWTIRLTETDKDLRAAKQRNDTKIARVQGLCDTLGIATQDTYESVSMLHSNWNSVQMSQIAMFAASS